MPYRIHIVKKNEGIPSLANVVTVRTEPPEWHLGPRIPQISVRSSVPSLLTQPPPRVSLEKGIIARQIASHSQRQKPSQTFPVQQQVSHDHTEYGARNAIPQFRLSLIPQPSHPSQPIPSVVVTTSSPVTPQSIPVSVRIEKPNGTVYATSHCDDSIVTTSSINLKLQNRFLSWFFENRARHVSSPPLPGHFKCVACGKVFLKSSALNAHLERRSLMFRYCASKEHSEKVFLNPCKHNFPSDFLLFFIHFIRDRCYGSIL